MIGPALQRLCSRWFDSFIRLRFALVCRDDFQRKLKGGGWGGGGGGGDKCAQMSCSHVFNTLFFLTPSITADSTPGTNSVINLHHQTQPQSSLGAGQQQQRRRWCSDGVVRGGGRWVCCVDHIWTLTVPWLSVNMVKLFHSQFTARLYEAQRICSSTHFCTNTTVL